MENKQAVYDKIINQMNLFYNKYNKNGDLGMTAKMASLSSIVRMSFSDLKFIGFYVVKNSDYLEIGPYVSDILATPLIGFGKGVCGTAWKESNTVIINNVSKCNNYIACDEETQSEIVIPVIRDDSVIAVWDIDSIELDRFDDIDKTNLEYLIKNFL